MKSSILKLFFFVSGFLFLASATAQSFRYDTVPAPNKNQRQLYGYERPVNQQSNNQAKQPEIKKESGFDKRKLIVGGHLGLGLGSDYTFIDVSPQIGYQFSRYFAGGGGINYTYYKSYDWSRNYLGMNLYARITPIQYIAFQVQPEVYRMWDNYYNNSEIVPCLLVGAGVIIPAGKGGISMMLYYDLIQDKYSPHNSRLIYSVGYIFSF